MRISDVIFNLFFIITYVPLIYPLIGDEYNIGVLYHESDPWNSEIAIHTVINYYNTHGSEKFRMGAKFVSEFDYLSANQTVCELTSTYQGVVGIIGPSNPSIASLVQSISGNLEIPHIQYHWRDNVGDDPEMEKMVVNFYPETNLLAEGLATIVENMHWKGFTILYENSDSLIRLKEVFKMINSDHKPVIVRQIDEDIYDYRPLLKEINNYTDNPIILDCALERILPLLRDAGEVNMLELNYRYFLTNLDAHTLDFHSLKNNSANITTVRLFNPNSKDVHNLIVNLRRIQETNDKDRFAQKFTLKESRSTYELSANKLKVETVLIVDAVEFYLDTFVQIIKSSNGIRSERLTCDGMKQWDRGIQFPSFMRTKTEEGVSGPIQFDRFGRRIDFRLEVVEIHDKETAQVAEWTPNEKFNITRNETAHQQQVTQSLRKGKVIVISRLGMPYLREKEGKEGEEDDDHLYEGFSMDIIKEIAKEINFTFEFRVTADYGKFNPKTNSWNGILGDLIARRAHLGICDLTITHERRSLVDFSLPFMNLGVSILYSKAKIKDEGSRFAFMEPFDKQVWFYTVTLYLGVSLAVYVLCRIAPGDWENPHPCNQEPEEFENIWSLKNCFWLMLGSIMTQGCDILPKGISSRLGTSMWWFFSLILTSSYTANLAAFLTKAAMGTTINSAEDLAKQTKIKYGTVEGGATQAFFRKSNFSTYQRMWANMVQARPKVFENSNADGVRRVNNTKNQLYAFLMESSSIEYEMEKNCNLRRVGGLLDSRSYGIAMPLNAEYRSAIDNTLLKLQEAGVLSALKNKWWKEKVVKEVPCDESDEGTKSSDALALSNVGGVFILLGVGIAVAFLLAFIEFLWNVRKVAVEEHISYWEALWLELKFAANVWVTQKKVKPTLADSSSGGSDTKSIAQRIIHGAESILNMKTFRLND